MFANKNRGFTLIELLVVIAIIGILSSVVLASLNSARQKSRDARRIGDIKQLQLAAEMYYDTNTSYPANIAALATGGFIPSEPTDPSTSASYGYSTTSTAYILGANLETNHSVLGTDIDGTTNAGAVDCDAESAAPYGYCVQP